MVTNSIVHAKFDTIGIAVPIDDFDRVGCKHTIDNQHTAEEGHKWSRQLKGGGFLATGFGNRAWIEASIPKRVDKHSENTTALEAVEMVLGLEDLAEEASKFLSLTEGHRFEDSKVIRVDFVRDFSGVDDLGMILDGLAHVEQPGRSKVRRFADPSKGQAETLRVGPRAWGCTLYDKHAETGGSSALAPPGSLRFEARLHQDQMSSTFNIKNGGGIRTVGDLMGRDERLASMQRAWFRRAGFDKVVMPRDQVGEMIRSLTEVTPAVRGSLWAYLTLPGFAADLHRHTRRKYRQLASDLGVCPTWFRSDDTVRAVPETVGLDYDRGLSLEA